MAWTAPRTWAALEQVTAVLFNTHIRDNLLSLSTWEAYTPALTNITLGNGVLTGRKSVSGKMVDFYISLTWGSTTSASGNFTFSLPVNPLNNADEPIGDVFLRDASAAGTAARRLGTAMLFSVNTAQICMSDGVIVTTALPWTWATGDIINCRGRYESA